MTRLSASPRGRVAGPYDLFGATRAVLALLMSVAQRWENRRAVKNLLDWDDHALRDIGLTRAQWLVLTRVYRRPGVSQTELADMLEIDRASAGRMIDRMEKNGWVERRPDSGDRRINRLHLTADARKVHTAMWAIAESTVDDALSPLSADERAQYAELTAKVKGRLQALAGAVP